MKEKATQFIRMETSDQRLKVISHETREVYRLSQPTALSQCNNVLETKYAYASSPRCGTPAPGPTAQW